EQSPDLPILIARLLVHAVERRLRRNLSRGYREVRTIESRVRGRIEVLPTFTGRLLEKGEIACRYEENTIDTTRNRLVRAALEFLSARIVDDELVSHRCRTLAGDLARLCVAGKRPSRSDVARDQIGRNEAEDALMVSLARIVFDLV